MPVIETLRRLDDRFVPTGGKASARAVRWLPWVLLVAYLAHLASLFTDIRFLDGVVSGLLLASVGTAFVDLPTRTRDHK